MDAKKLALLRDGAFFPAQPLCLTQDRKLDERRQRALTRYYRAAGADGVAVGVHTTQFAIREHGLLEPVLRMAAQEAGKEALMIAGAAGPQEQAVREAQLARDLGYDMVLLSCAGLPQLSEVDLIRRAQAVGEVLPLFGFYLQPAVGGRALSREYWRELSELPSLLAVKIAPFNRYQTLDVVRGVCASTRREEITLYTGNDDSIVTDLLTPFAVEVDGEIVKKPIVGGLLGHWAAWTQASVRIFQNVRALARSGGAIPPEMLTLAAQVTEANAALFDAGNGFAGCIPGVHEALRRVGLMENLITLDPEEKLSPGQAQEIERIARAYPHLVDDDFVAEHLPEWLA